jgi:hypothetical protein
MGLGMLHTDCPFKDYRTDYQTGMYRHLDRQRSSAMKQSSLPEGFAFVLFALVMFFLTAALVIAGIASRPSENTTVTAWLPDGILWVAVCINAHSIISRLAMRD